MGFASYVSNLASLEDPTPDHSTLSVFRKRLSEGKPGLLNSTFEFLKDKLLKKGLILKKGVIVDASVVPAPKGSAGAERGKRRETG